MLIIYTNQEFRVLKEKEKYKDDILFLEVSSSYLITTS